MTVPIKTQKRPANPPLRSPTLSDLLNMSNAETEWESTAFDHLHQYKFPSSHIHGDETQSRKKVEVPLGYRN